MSSTNPDLIFAFVAVIGGLVAYVAVFALLTTFRDGNSRREPSPEKKEDYPEKPASLHSQRILDLRPRVGAPPASAR